MQLGNLTLTTISGGTFRTDGGTMFGVVPRLLWEPVYPADEQHRIPQATNCLLVRSDAHTVLIDTGYGARMSVKQRKHLVAEEGNPLLASLEAAGVTAGEIDTVILTHLHFDHVGGALLEDESGQVVPAFPEAAYVVQSGEYERATSESPELRAAYSPEWVTPLAEAGQLEIVEGDVELRPGIHAIVTGGHTRFHQSLVLESDGEGAFYAADLCPTTRHLPTLWCMGYDEEVLETRRRKPELLGRAVAEDWWVLFGHDPDLVAAKLVAEPRRDFTVAEGMASL